MNLEDCIREPWGAAALAGGATVAYIHLKAKINNEAKPQTSQFVKPAILVAILVYFIVMVGSSQKERISAEPF